MHLRVSRASLEDLSCALRLWQHCNVGVRWRARVGAGVGWGGGEVEERARAVREGKDKGRNDLY